MRGICKIVREFFYGPAEVTPPVPTNNQPPVETFCRSNRYTDWLVAMQKDCVVVGAKYVTIRCYDDPIEYRAVVSDTFDENKKSHAVFYNTLTLETISVGVLFQKGVEKGGYWNDEKPEYDDRPEHELPANLRQSRRPDPREHQCIARFKNHVNYTLRSMWHRSLPWNHFPEDAKNVVTTPGNGKRTTLGEQWRSKWDMAKEWNNHHRVVLGDIGGDYLLMKTNKLDFLFNDLWGRSHILLMRVNRETGEPTIRFSLPLFCMRPYLDNVREFKLYDTNTGSITELFDPIRVRKLDPNEEHGLEAYVALELGKQKDTFTRVRYRVEVDSEKMYSGVICNLATLYAGVTKRLLAEGISDDGKLYVDNFHYMREDGTEHTPDMAGFSTIGAEPFYDRQPPAAVSHARDRYATHSSGPRIVTNQYFPNSPVY